MNCLKIYLAGPFFTKQQLKDNKIVAKTLKSKYGQDSVFVPQEHKIINGEHMPNNEWARKVFQMDHDALINSDIIFVCYYGFNSDTGTSWEQGCAYAHNKEIIILNFAQDKILSLMSSYNSKIIDCTNGWDNLENMMFDDLKNYDLK